MKYDIIKTEDKIMKKIIFVLFIFVLISCNNNIQENKKTEK